MQMKIGDGKNVAAKLRITFAFDFEFIILNQC